MESKVVSIPSSLDPVFSPPTPPKAEPNPARATVNEPAELRLVIEQDSDSGAYVYKTVDRRTGEIVQQFPRDQILRMHQDGEYAAGDVVSAKA